MSLNISEEKCSVCQAYLFEDDDIVYCPECGAPHHRDCYNSVGHCGLEQYHGTEKQYKRPQNETAQQAVREQPEVKDDIETVCQMCGKGFDRDSAQCPNCGAPNISKLGGRFIEIDLLGGVPADMDLGDGVTANEAKMFVATNTQRYIPKFADFKLGKKASWNWAAFLFPCAWFASRKMYSKAALIGTFQVAFSMLTFPFQRAISFLDFSGAKNDAQSIGIIMQILDKVGTLAFVAALVSSIFALILRIVCAIFADYSYRNRVISAVTEIKKSIEDPIVSYRRRGGMSLTAALIGLMAVQYLPAIFAMLIGIF